MSKKQIGLFDIMNISGLPWPDSEQARFAKSYLLPIIIEGADFYVTNVKARVNAILLDNLVLPVIITDKTQSDNSYICSFYSHYIEYGKIELAVVQNKMLKRTLLSTLETLGILMSIAQIDKTVYVNNWLVPTNLYPSLTREQIERLTTELITHFPQHTIAFRSINSLKPAGLMDGLKKNGYELLISRMIYYTEQGAEEPFQSRMFKSDLNLSKKSPYQQTSGGCLSEKAVSRICELYRMLNIEKYSVYNPQYNENFIRLIEKNPNFKLHTFTLNNQIDAAMAYYELGEEMTSPFFAYDTSLPPSIGLYRKISTLLLLEAKEKKRWLHQSGGGGSFKSLRRASNSLEYTAVYTKHLPLGRRIFWKILYKAVNPLIKYFFSRHVI